ncbi:MAG: hypothetical protein M5U26_10030 [Planctomycetota bacterium]|nr:hypothetical protein [Planctomycetota bacterium]
MLRSKWILMLSLAALALGGRGYGAADGFKVTTDRTVDSSSLESIVADVTRLSGAKDNNEKAIALYRYLHQVLFHNAYPNEKKPQSVGPLKAINVYGWGLCGGQHTVMKAVYETAGWDVRYRGWSSPGHTTVEVNYDGKWHYFDVFLKSYFWTKDKSTIAGQDDIVADPSIVLQGKDDGRVPEHGFLCCGDTAEGIVQGCKNSKAYPAAKHEDGWASVTGRDRGYSALPRLLSGAALKVQWEAREGEMVADGTPGVHSCGTKDFRYDPVLGPILIHYGRRQFANGAFTYRPDFGKPADAVDVELANAKADGGKLVASGAGSAVFKLALPYPYSTAKVDAAFENGEGKLSLSTDGGKTWSAAAPGDLSAQVRQRYDVWLKAEFTGALAKFGVDAGIEHNRGAQPFLHDGKNVVTVSTRDNKLPEGAALKVTYAFQEATAPGKLQRYDQPQNLKYGETKTVSEVITRLPHSFTIDVGGNLPPKMLYIERAVVAK